jgi:hypothetical protein
VTVEIDAGAQAAVLEADAARERERPGMGQRSPPAAPRWWPWAARGRRSWRSSRPPGARGSSASPSSPAWRSSSRAGSGGPTRARAALIAVGGAFLTTAIALGSAQGIFHPCYVSLAAPFTAALAGAGFAQLSEGGRTARVLGPLAVLAGGGAR